MDIKEILIILAASLILGLSFSIPNVTYYTFSLSAIFFLIIIIVNLIGKHLVAYFFEADIETKFWSVYHYGFKQGSHFARPLPMAWLPLLLSFIFRGFFQWLSILEFDVKPKIERSARRHGIYGFTELEDYHVAMIAAAGVAANLIIAILSYFLASIYPTLELFARLNIYFAFWSMIPLGSLDGSKFLFGSRGTWFIMLVITAIFLAYALLVV